MRPLKPASLLAWTLILHLTIVAAPRVHATLTNVNVQASSFNPSAVAIKTGDQVKWTWLASFHNSVSDSGLWNSGTQSAGFTFTNTFANAGTFPYRCTIHQFTGSVTVQAPTAPPALLSAPVRVPPSTFEFNYSAGSGLSYVVQRSTNLTSWLSLATNVAGGSSVPFKDNNASNSSSFYRVFQLVSP